MSLWEQIRNKHEQRRQNAVANNNNNTNNSMLYNMLTNDKISPQSSSLNSENLTDGIGGITKAVKTFGGAFGSAGDSSASPIMNSLTGSAGSGSAIKDGVIGAVNGTGSGTAITNAFNNSTGATSAAGGATKGGFGGFGGGFPWAAIGGLAKGAYNEFSGKDDKDYSDTEESIIYPLQGASMGSMFGPWGAAGGALYGLGYSFKDDLGMKDSNFLTKLVFPIGMGDGGGFIDLG